MIRHSLGFISKDQLEEVMEYIKNTFGKLSKGTRRNIIYITIISCNVIIPYLIWLNKNIQFLPYNIDNYRYIISAALQSIAAIFAFIASSTILIIQFSSDNSPTSISFFPKKSFFLVMIEFLTIIAVDGFILITLSTELNELHLFIVNLILFLNVESIALIIIYVMAVLRWLKPETMFEILLNNAKQAGSNEERLEIVLSIEELTLKAIQKGYSSSTKKAIDLFDDIVEIYSTQKTNLNLDVRNNTDHPLRVIPSSISRIVQCLCKNDMDDLVHLTAWPLSRLSIISASNDDLSVCSIFVSSATQNIIKECLQKNLDSAAYNFTANLSYSVDSNDNADSIAKCITSIIDEALKHESSEYVISQAILGYSRLAEDHINEIEVHCKKAVSEIKKYPIMLSKKGWFTNVTISNQILSLEDLLKKSHKINKQIKKRA